MGEKVIHRPCAPPDFSERSFQNIGCAYGLPEFFVKFIVMETVEQVLLHASVSSLFFDGPLGFPCSKALDRLLAALHCED